MDHRREARKTGDKQLAKDLKGARFALWKNPEKLTDRQQPKLTLIHKLNASIYRARLLKELLRQIYDVPHDQALTLRDGWLNGRDAAASSRSASSPRRSPHSAKEEKPR